MIGSRLGYIGTAQVVAAHLLVSTVASQAATLYVAPGGSHVPPYTNWLTAATNIQAAVDTAGGGDTVLLTNAAFALSSQVTVTNGLTILGATNGTGAQVSGAGRTRCFYLSHPGAVLDGLTIADGCAGDGGGVYVHESGTVLNCTITNNTATNAYSREEACGGGGICLWNGGIVRDCLIVANSATNEGGGILCYSNGLITHCEIRHNTCIDDGAGVTCRSGGVVRRSLIEGNVSSDKGGGAQAHGAGRVEHCIVRHNSANYGGGGIYTRNGGTARNCLVTQNSAALYGGGIVTYFVDAHIESCTIVSNSANNGGGIYLFSHASIENSIMCFNTATENYDEINGDSARNPTISNCCCTLLLPGTGNITNNPSFIDMANGDYRLAEGSPCIDAGVLQPWMYGAHDLQDADRVLGPRVDIGAYESAGAFSCSFTTASRHLGGGAWEAVLTAHAGGTNIVQPYFVWDLDADGIRDCEGLEYSTLTRIYDGTGLHRATLTVENATGEKASYTSVFSVGPAAYVSSTGSDVYPYASAADAARSVHAALAAVVNQGGSVVIVLGGTYQLTDQVTLTDPIEIHGHGNRDEIVVRAATGQRCFYLDNPGAAVANLTITGGSANNGGGVYIDSGGTVSDCSIVSNEADWGAGVYVSEKGTVQRCLISDNSGSSYGTGAYLKGGLLRDCVITRNGDTAYGGAGVHCSGNTLVRHCTIVSNRCVGRWSYCGGVVREGSARVWDSIVYDNDHVVRVGEIHVSNWKGEGTATSFLNCCTTPLPPGTGNITNTPGFVNLDAGDVRLAPGSPCIDQGLAGPESGQDIDGIPRPLDGNGDGRAVSDMGAYEYFLPTADSDGDGLTDTNELYVVGTSPVSPDTDGDTSGDGDEVIAGTDPLSPFSVFAIHDEWYDASSRAVVLSWNSITGRLYTVQHTDDLVSGPWTDLPARTEIPGTGSLLNCTNPAAAAPSYHRVLVRHAP